MDVATVLRLAKGRVVAFGLGGVLAEGLKDVRFALATFSADEAARTIRSIRGLPALQGYRGRPGMDLEFLGELATRVSRLGRDTPKIRELDIDPLKGVRHDLSAVDVPIVSG